MPPLPVSIVTFFCQWTVHAFSFELIVHWLEWEIILEPQIIRLEIWAFCEEGTMKYITNKEVQANMVE